jgi:8-oxo-dGTP pyrophosphatase MutT (NUDIX family)
MTDLEIRNILITDNFDLLWCDLWKKTARNKNYEKEFISAQEKFNILKKNHLEIIKTFKPKYPIPEWGFPKGRRNILEKDITCAKRECQEETSLDMSEMGVLDRIYPVVEELKGTNNIQYKHVYFLSIVESNRNLNVITTPEQHIEVENVGWFKYDRVMNLIRPYHTEKKKLVDDIIKFIAYNILWFESTR